MNGRLKIILTLARQGFDPAQILYRLALRKLLKDCNSILEVGCGKSPNMKWIGATNSTGVDGFEPYVEIARRDSLHQQVLQGDVRNLEQYFQPGQFDAVIALDVIEHLPKEDGLQMMRSMEKIAQKKSCSLPPAVICRSEALKTMTCKNICPAGNQPR